MHTKSRPFPTLIFLLAIATTAFSQQANPAQNGNPNTKATEQQKARASGETAPMRKITEGHGDIDIDINVQESIDVAMRAVQAAMENLEIELGHIEIDIPEIHIDIPDIDVGPFLSGMADIDAIEVNDIDIDIDIDRDNFNWHSDDDHDAWRNEEWRNEDLDRPGDKDKLKEKSEKADKDKDKLKEKSEKMEKDKDKEKKKEGKTKGLKKVN